MGEFEKHIARSFYFWMVRFLRTKYNNVKIVFISHHTEAKEVTEEEFYLIKCMTFDPCDPLCFRKS